MYKAARWAKVLVIIVMLFAFVPMVAAQDEVPSVTVEDQAIENDQVTIASVYSDGPGWIVIHADDNGSPGEVVGYAAVTEGENTDVTVDIDTEMATETLYAMLHEDLGTEGTYEFPGDDGPVQVDGEVVVEPFTVTGGLAAEDEAAAEDDDEAEAAAEDEDEAAAEDEDEDGQMLPATGRVMPWGWVALIGSGVMLISLGLGLGARKVPVRDDR